MDSPFLAEFGPGRFFSGRLSPDGDVIAEITHFCRDVAVKMAVFSLYGSVSSVTLGTYDQKQQVYVTFTETGPREIVACQGNVSLQDGNPIVYAHLLLADEGGTLVGGRLFSETRIFAGEIVLQELAGPPLQRAYDQTTGLMLWPNRTRTSTPQKAHTIDLPRR